MVDSLVLSASYGLSPTSSGSASQPVC